MEIIKQGKLLCNNGKEQEEKELPETKYLAIYFSAHWCPPCRAFTPTLSTFYEEVNAKEKLLEIIFCSSDKSQNAFTEYFSEMDWMAIPFGDERSQKLKTEFNITGIPRILVLDSNGNIINKNARKDIMEFGSRIIERW